MRRDGSRELDVLEHLEGAVAISERRRFGSPKVADDDDVLERRSCAGTGRGIWNVRPTPRRHIRSAGHAGRVASVEPDACPRWGAMPPARQLSSVDFPAPLGPMRPKISPSST